MNIAARTARRPQLAVLFLVFLGAGLDVHAATNIYVLDTPDYAWYYGCMGTASGNLMGYWDRHGFPDFYTGTVNGGVAPLTTSGANSSITALWASKAGLDGRPAGSPGHVDDYYRAFESTGPDPYLEAGRPAHSPDCIADFIGMDQFKWQQLGDECRGNIDGFCFVSWDLDGERRTNYRPNPAANDPDLDVQTGLRAWARWRGSDADVFTQLVDFNPTVGAGKGFTFADLKAEIDAGYPVLLFLQRYDQFSRTLGGLTNVNPAIHSMLAYGYYINSGRNYVRYRTSWASGSNRIKEWTSQYWEAELPVRGVIGFHPLPTIRSYAVEQGNFSLTWDGPASDVYDATLGISTRAHGYVVELSASLAPADFQPISPVLLTNRYTVTNCPSPAYLRLKLVPR